MKTYLLYGFAMALANAMFVIVLYLLGLHSDPAKLAVAQVVGLCGSITIGAVCLSLGIKARSAEAPASEEFGYGRALGAGVMIALVAALFSLVTTFVYAKFINPEFVDVIAQAQTAKLEAKGLTAAQIESAQKAIRIFMGPVAQAVSGFFGGLLFGTLISLVAAAFLKRPAAPPSFDSPPPIA